MPSHTFFLCRQNPPPHTCSFFAGETRHLTKALSLQAKFITSRSSGYNYDSVPSGHSSHGVSFGSQTMRTDHMFKNTVGHSSGTSGDGGSGGVARYNQAIRLNNNAATSGSAYAMDLNHSLTGSRILDRPYHPASASFCDLHPDNCFFSPQPETQGMGGGYHSI